MGLVLFAFGVQPPPVSAASLTPNDLQILATAVAAAHHLDAKAFLGTLENESQWKIHARGDYQHGVATSFGLCQFHDLARWHMTLAEADNPYYCLERMAEEWEVGGAHLWSGYALYLAEAAAGRHTTRPASGST